MHDRPENNDGLDFRVVVVFVFDDVDIGRRICFFEVFHLVKNHPDVIFAFLHDQVNDIIFAW